MKFGAGAQTSVRIIDFLVLPAYHTDTVAQTDTVVLNVMFKTKNAVQANKAMLLFGTANDAGDIKLAEANFTTANDTTFIVYNGLSEPVLNYATNITIMMPRQQYDAFTHATLYVEDSNSLQTQHLYFQKH